MSTKTMHTLKSIAIGLIGLTLTLVLPACTMTDKAGARADRPLANQPVPDYAEIRDNYNARVEGMDRLWARLIAKIDGKEDDGSAVKEQAEGHLQVIRPGNLALTLGKLGDTAFHLGSNEEFYWWIDMADSNGKIALVGRNAIANDAAIAAFGLPIHPLDLIELLSITPLPDEPITAEGRRPVFHAKGVGAIGFEVPATWGYKRIWVNADTFEPERVEVRASDDRLLAVAMLDRYENVAVTGDATIHPRVATRINIRAAGFDGSVRLTLSGPRNKSIKPIVYDLDRLLKAYRVDDVRNVDAWVDSQRRRLTSGQ